MVNKNIVLRGESMKITITKYYCDACESEVQFEEDLTLVTFGIHFKQEHVTSTETLRGHSQICSECLKELGFDSPVVTYENKMEFQSEFNSEKRNFSLFKKFRDLFKCK